MRKQNAEKKWTQKSKIDHNPSEVTTHSRDKTKSNKVADGKDRSIVTGCKSNSLGLSVCLFVCLFKRTAIRGRLISCNFKQRAPVDLDIPTSKNNFTVFYSLMLLERI